MTSPTITRSKPSSALRQVLAGEYLALVGFLLVLCVFFSWASPFFLAYNNVLNILTAMAVTGIIAVPATMLLVSGQIDLSVGAGVAFCGVTMAQVAQSHSILVAVLVTVAVGAVIGAVNGFLVTVVGVNSLITTLGTLAILSGGAKLVAGGQTVILSGFSTLGQSRPLLNIPLSVIILLLVLALGALVLKFSVFGRQLYSVGGNAVAARLVGIRAGRVIFTTFVLSGLAVTLSALILTSQLGAGSPISAVGLELSVVTAVVLGGTSLSGGRGTIVGTILGLLIIGVLANGLILLNVDPFWQDIARGALLILAVSFDRVRVRLAARRRTQASSEDETAGPAVTAAPAPPVTTP